MLDRIWAFLDECFFGPASNREGLLALIIRALRYPYALIRDLVEGEINLRAMSLVYTSLLSLIPLVAFSFAILKVFGAHWELEPVVLDFFKPVGQQAATQLTAKVMQFADRLSSGVLGTVGFALLAWTVMDTIKKVEDSFNFLWRVEQPRSFARRIAEYLTLMVIGPLLVVTFVGLSHETLTSAPMQVVEQIPLVQRLPALLIALAPYVMVTTFFLVMYMIVPNTRVLWRPALIGAIVAGVAWAAVGRIFTEFVVYSTRLNLMYAGFAFLVAAFLWTYLGWLILLAGAQLAFYIQNPAYLRLGLHEVRLSCAELERLALKMMYFVGCTHVLGSHRWSMNKVARELGLPGIAVAKMATALQRAGLIVISKDNLLECARDLEQITAYDILKVARNQRSGRFAPRHTPIPTVDELTERLDDQLKDSCANVTLRDLISQPQAGSAAPGISSAAAPGSGTAPPG